MYPTNSPQSKRKSKKTLKRGKVPESIYVQLTDADADRAAIVGVRRELRAMKDRLKDRYQWERDGFKQHIEGAMGELAASTALNMPWSGEDINQFKGADIGENVQVRYRPGSFKDLSLRHGDKKTDIFVLVLPADPSRFIFEVVGWMSGKDAMTDRFYHEDKKLWFVPGYLLHDITTIPGYVPRVSQDPFGLWD
jgi:hypothetical protein